MLWGAYTSLGLGGRFLAPAPRPSQIFLENDHFRVPGPSAGWAIALPTPNPPLGGGGVAGRRRVHNT